MQRKGSGFVAGSFAVAVCSMVAGCSTIQHAGSGEEPGRFVASGGAEVYCEFHPATEKPERTPLVFVHGWACDHQYWAPQVEGMSHDRDMLTLDLPGYGQSTDGGAAHSMDLYADAVIAAMDQAGIDRAVLIGHSMGTPVVRQVYRNHPGRVAGLVGVDGGLRPLGSPEQMKQFVAPMYGEQWREFVTQMFDGMSSTMAHEEDRALVRNVMLATTQRSMIGGFEAMSDESVWVTDPIDVPLLLVLAESPFWNDDYKRYVRGLAADVQFVQFTGVSHFLMMDDPSAFDQTVENWLERTGL